MSKKANLAKNIKFKLTLSEEQKQAKAKIIDDDICRIAVLTGSAGSAKTFLSTQIALDMVFNGVYNKIYLTRPTVASEDIGFLTGDKNEKYKSWCTPILDNMYKLYDKKKIDTMLEDGRIEFLPIQFIRGITIDNAVAIIDESQNLTRNQVELICGRIGKNGKIIFTGDNKQVDLKQQSDSGLNNLISIANRVKGLCHIELTQNHRDPIVTDIMKHLYQIEDSKPQKVKQNTFNERLLKIEEKLMINT